MKILNYDASRRKITKFKAYRNSKLSKVQPDELKTHFVALNSIKLAMKLAPATRFSRTFPWNDE